MLLAAFLLLSAHSWPPAGGIYFLSVFIGGRPSGLPIAFNLYANPTSKNLRPQIDLASTQVDPTANNIEPTPTQDRDQVFHGRPEARTTAGSAKKGAQGFGRYLAGPAPIWSAKPMFEVPTRSPGSRRDSRDPPELPARAHPQHLGSTAGVTGADLETILSRLGLSWGWFGVRLGVWSVRVDLGSIWGHVWCAFDRIWPEFPPNVAWN